MRKAEISRKRTIREQRNFFDETMREIEKSKIRIKNARLRKGLYKSFFEEYAVLLLYSELKYGLDSNVKFRWVDIQGQTINYDGEIYKDGQVIEKVEITCPLIRENDKIVAKELNKCGYSSMEVEDLQSALYKVKDKIIKQTQKKNSKNQYDESITLVVHLEDYIHFYDGVKICAQTLEQIIEELSQEIYRFKSVYILQSINNNHSLISIK